MSVGSTFPAMIWRGNAAMAVSSATSLPTLMIVRSGTGTFCQCSRFLFCSPQMWMNMEDTPRSITCVLIRW